MSPHMFSQYELRPTNGWDPLASLGHPCKFQRVSRLDSVATRHSIVVDVRQTLWRWTEGPTYIRQGGHHVGHWPTFLVVLSFSSSVVCVLSVCCAAFVWKWTFYHISDKCYFTKTHILLQCWQTSFSCWGGFRPQAPAMSPTMETDRFDAYACNSPCTQTVWHVRRSRTSIS